MMRRLQPYLSHLFYASNPCQAQAEDKKEKEQLDQEEKEFAKRGLLHLQAILKEQVASHDAQVKYRSDLKEEYMREAKLRKYQHSMQSRLAVNSKRRVFKEIGQYSLRMTLIRADDDILYEYRRKLQRQIQWALLCNQVMPVLGGAFFFYLTRYLKGKNDSDFMYFIIPYLYLNYGVFMGHQKELFEKGYPAHPKVHEFRTKVLSNVCFNYPRILKNEIEYLHYKIHGFKDDETADPSTRYERTFSTK